METRNASEYVKSDLHKKRRQVGMRMSPSAIQEMELVKLDAKTKIAVGKQAKEEIQAILRQSIWEEVLGTILLPIAGIVFGVLCFLLAHLWLDTAVFDALKEIEAILVLGSLACVIPSVLSVLAPVCAVLLAIRLFWAVPGVLLLLHDIYAENGDYKVEARQIEADLVRGQQFKKYIETRKALGLDIPCSSDRDRKVTEMEYAIICEQGRL